MTDDHIQCIHDANLSYLLLAQRLIKEDPCCARFLLGLSESVINTLKGLSLQQLINFSSVGQLICRLRIDKEDMLNSLTKASRVDGLQHIHSGIVLSTELIESLPEANSEWQGA